MTAPTNDLTAAERLRQAIANHDSESLLDLLDARRERTIRRLRQAVRELRATNEATAAAHERLAAHLACRRTDTTA
ncbi:hypothetical protein [Streptomyces sp. NPDC001781]